MHDNKHFTAAAAAAADTTANFSFWPLFVFAGREFVCQSLTWCHQRASIVPTTIPKPPQTRTRARTPETKAGNPHKQEAQRKQFFFYILAEKKWNDSEEKPQEVETHFWVRQELLVCFCFVVFTSLPILSMSRELRRTDLNLPQHLSSLCWPLTSWIMECKISIKAGVSMRATFQPWKRGCRVCASRCWSTTFPSLNPAPPESFLSWTCLDLPGGI